MYKAKIPFMSGHTMFRAGDEIPANHPSLSKLIDKGLVIEIKVKKPTEIKAEKPAKSTKPKRTRARKNDDLPKSKTKQSE